MEESKEVRQIPIEDIIPNRFQPRINFDEKALNELADSIKQHGIIQPLVLRPLGDKFEIIAGERRYKAATIAGLSTVPAIVTDMDDNTSAEVALIENVQRKDLTSIEEAKSYKNMLDRGNMTQEELAKKMGLSQSTIANKLRLLNLDESVQNALMQEKISERHARALLSISNKEDQKRWLDRIINERLTVRQLDLAIKDELNEKKQLGAQEGDIPIVDINPDIESIINNAVDINPVDNKKDIDLFNGPTPAPIPTENTVPEVNNTPAETVEEIKDPEPIAKPQNKFFNILESEEANMSMEEEPKTKSPEPVENVNGVFNFQPEFIDAEENKVEYSDNNIEEENTTEPVVEDKKEDIIDEPIFSIEEDTKEQVEEPAEEIIKPELNEPTPILEPAPINEPEPVEVKEEINEQLNNSEFIFDDEPELLDSDKEDDFVAEPIPPMVGEGIVDPVTYYDTLDPSFVDRIKAYIGVDLKTAINTYRDVTTLLNQKGFNISLDETDGDGNYKIEVNINKE